MEFSLLTMKRLLILLSFMFVIGFPVVCAQYAKQPIKINTVLGGYEYYYYDLKINSLSQMKQIVRDDSEALAQMRWASVDNGFRFAFDFIGGFAIGYELAMLITGNNALKLHYAVPIVVGAGSFAIAYLFSRLADNRMAKGARIYNGNLGKTSYGEPVQLDFGLVPGGIGLTLSF